MSPRRSASPVQGLPPIQWVTCLVVMPLRPRSRVDRPEGVDQEAESFARLVLGQREGRGHPEGGAVQAALADEQAALLGRLERLGGQLRAGRAGGGVGQVDGEHEALAAHVGDGLELVGGLLEASMMISPQACALACRSWEST